MALKTYYPRETLLPTPESMELWYEQLKDLDYEVITTGLNKWVATNKWSPAISDIRAMAMDVTKGEIPDWGEGWDRVTKAISNYGYVDRPKAMESFGYDKVGIITRECAQRLGWFDLCNSENKMADRANFRMLFEEIAEKDRNKEVLPPKTKQDIDKLIEQNKPEVVAIENKTPVIEDKFVEKPKSDERPLSESVQRELDELLGRS